MSMKLFLFTLALFNTLHVSAATSKVTIHLLDHTDKIKTKTRFWIDWSKQWRGIISSKTVTNEAADKIIKQLGLSLKNTEAEHFCGHDPIYGIETITADGKTRLRLDINGERGPNNELCKLLREVIELPPELLTEEVRRPLPKRE